ncbi:hypothetical protein [Alicyclobacillus sp. SO9]|uniref:hypothetical protein n=1 Tax=Alicyclobacillus sp. SO9 TaxID=2665646 RepID=UPI0018E801C6|nr:hypothetical protein [Alicyclobacillus sp. SO9]QQE79651.1 hypothetical protein GI364_03950 [Alicyclobacillus sp. SO9]
MKMRRRVMKVIGLSTLISGALSTQIAYAGTLSVQGASTVTFPPTTLKGIPQSVTANMPPLTVGDTRGSGNGYHITVQGSQLKEVGGRGHTLPAGSLQLAAPSKVVESAQDGVNLIPNAGFESYSSGPTANGWAIYGSGGSSSAQVVTSPVHSGNHAQKFVGSGIPQSTGQQLYHDIPSVTPGASFQAGIYLDITAISGATVNVGINWFSSSGAYLSTSSATKKFTASNNTYELTSLTGTVPQNATSARMNITIGSISSSGSATLFADDAYYQSNHVTVPQGSSNIVLNSGFEQKASGTSTLFSTNLTSGQPWNVTTGAESFASNGATNTGSGNTLVQTKTGGWTPSSTPAGTSLPLTEQVTFTTPSTVPASVGVDFLQGNGYYYRAVWQGGDNNFVIYKEAPPGRHEPPSYIPLASTGTGSNIVRQVANTQYTMTFSIDSSGKLVASIYGGRGTGGYKLTTISASDTSLSGPFQMELYSGPGMRYTSAQLTGLWPNGWSVYTGGTVGTYATSWIAAPVFAGQRALKVSAYNEQPGGAQFWLHNITVTGGRPFTATVMVNPQVLSGVAAVFQIDWFNSNGSSIGGTGSILNKVTEGYVPMQITGTVPSSATSAHIDVILRDTTSGGYGTMLADDVRFQYGQTGVPLIPKGPWTGDNNTASTVLSSQTWDGMGRYIVEWPSQSFTLKLEPKSTYTDPSSSSITYQSQLTYSIVSGP